MIIQPGTNEPSVLSNVELMRLDSKRFIDVTFLDDAGTATNIVEEVDSSGNPKGTLELNVTDIGNNTVYEESYWPIPIPDERRIVNDTTGHYYMEWGTESGESDVTGPLLFNWAIRKDAGEETFYRTQLVEVVSPKVLALLPFLRLQLDKSLKISIPSQYCNLGYSDSQLIMYLNMGLSRINAAQPYVGWLNMDYFPLDRGLEILVRASMVSALESQALFATDTDIVSYSDQGHAFSFSHYPQLKGLRDSFVQELDRDIQRFKLHYVKSGSIGAEFRLGWSFYQTLVSSPPGALFRNTIAYRP